MFSLPMDVANPEFDTFANSVDFPLLVDHKPGTYVLRIIHEGLAEGTLALVRPLDRLRVSQPMTTTLNGATAPPGVGYVLAAQKRISLMDTTAPAQTVATAIW
jgi:hypothetical protein